MNFAVLWALARRFPGRALVVLAAVLLAVGATLLFGKPGAGVGIGMLGLLLLQEHLHRLSLQSALRDVLQLLAEARGNWGEAEDTIRRLRAKSVGPVIAASMGKPGKQNPRMN